PPQQLSTSNIVVIDRANDGSYRAQERTVENERRIEMHAGTVQSSLYAATDAAGIPENITQQIIDIFESDIDFHLDLRRGDTFRVVYESYWLNGEFVRGGRVLAVEFVNGGVPYRAAWFETSPGRGAYYDFQGRSIKRAFLRSPLEFSRVSSGFSNSRFHPINQRWQAHRGVDYAAPHGTTVRSVAEGVVESAGWQNGYGNVVVIRHGPSYETLYAHLAGFASSIAKGMRVEQGQPIGYVGMTGWATGPHLHFEFHIDGQPNDPLKVELPNTAPIDAASRPAFETTVGMYRRQFALLAPTAVAAR
ncbi:MAG TPA: M23 family metallopeptidase, partial [Burkholderiaceae bacterium]|nr:M23 family metallopeptidase [Burkholderiaceae bacterium]